MRCLLLFAFAAAAYAQTCTAPEFSQHDQMLGAWANSAGEQVLFQKAVAGCVIVEDRSDGTKGILFHDPGTKAWRHVSVSPKGTVHDGAIAFDRQAWKPVKSFTAAAAAPTSASSCAKDFDFWLGKWRVTSPRGAMVGVNHIYPAAGGCVLVENWTNSTLNPGMSLNFFDRSAWRQIWVAPGGILDLAGKWNGSTLQFVSKDGFTRLTFTPNQDGSVRQFWEQSNDRGKSWIVSFDGMYTRAPAPTSALSADLQAATEATNALFARVTEVQSRFRPNTDRWNLQEILDHLVESERLFSRQAKALLSEPAGHPAFRPGPVDALLLPIVANRNRKLNAPPEIRPKSSAKTTAELLGEFQALRTETIAMLSAGANSVRLYDDRSLATHPLGSTPLPAGYWLAVAAAHNRRHLDQAEEVMRDPRFPASEPGLGQFTGHWSGDGTFQGKPVRVDASWTPVLDGKFHELQVRIRIAPNASFAGRAMYHASTLKASWSDSMGNAYDVAGHLENTTLASDWNGGKGRSTYSLDVTSGEMIITDAAGGKEFGRYRLKRSSAQPAVMWDIRPQNGTPWKAIYESGAMLVGVYNLAVGAGAGSKDEQAPHEHDEIYFIESGKAMLDAGAQRFPVQPGSIVMVRKGVSHRFHSIEQPLKVLVFFAKE